MQIQCPCCGEQFPFEAGFADADGKQLAALFAKLDPKLGRAVLNYLRLFSPAKRGLRMTKAVRLVEELLALVESGQVQRDARTGESKPAPARLWSTGIEQMIVQRDRLQLPLENHNYLRAVVFGIASDPVQAQAAAPAKPPRRPSRRARPPRRNKPCRTRSVVSTPICAWGSSQKKKASAAWRR